MDLDETELKHIEELTELKTDVAIIKQRVDDHDSSIGRLESIVSELDEDIKDMRRELGGKLDNLHKDALTSVPEWAARDLRKSGMSTGALIALVVGLGMAALTLLLYVFQHT